LKGARLNSEQQKTTDCTDIKQHMALIPLQIVCHPPPLVNALRVSEQTQEENKLQNHSQCHIFQQWSLVTSRLCPQNKALSPEPKP
jgi:hypothetical protein